MAEIFYRRHRFPPVIDQHAVWIYLRFPLSYRDVEDCLANAGSTCPTKRSGAGCSNSVPRSREACGSGGRGRATDHLDEMVVQIAGRRMYLWCAVDHEGEILDLLIQPRRDKRRR